VSYFFMKRAQRPLEEKADKHEIWKTYWPRKIIVILGPPGAGRTTQATALGTALDIPSFSTGDMLRQETAQNSQACCPCSILCCWPWPSAKKTSTLKKGIEHKMTRGELVEDDFVLRLLEARIGEADCRHGFVLDGFPRSVKQAKAFEEILAKWGEFVSVALVLSVEDQDHSILEKRTSGRTQDSIESHQQRMQNYSEHKTSILEHYDKSGVLRTIDATMPIDAVQCDCLEKCQAKDQFPNGMSGKGPHFHSR